jgi:hypothetical protein
MVEGGRMIGDVFPSFAHLLTHPLTHSLTHSLPPSLPPSSPHVLTPLTPFTCHIQRKDTKVYAALTRKLERAKKKEAAVGGMGD